MCSLIFFVSLNRVTVNVTKTHTCKKNFTLTSLKIKLTHNFMLVQISFNAEMFHLTAHARESPYSLAQESRRVWKQSHI